MSSPVKNSITSNNSLTWLDTHPTFSNDKLSLNRIPAASAASALSSQIKSPFSLPQSALLSMNRIPIPRLSMQKVETTPRLTLHPSTPRLVQQLHTPMPAATHFENYHQNIQQAPQNLSPNQSQVIPKRQRVKISANSSDLPGDFFTYPHSQPSSLSHKSHHLHHISQHQQQQLQLQQQLKLNGLLPSQKNTSNISNFINNSNNMNISGLNIINSTLNNFLGANSSIINNNNNTSNMSEQNGILPFSIKNKQQSQQSLQLRMKSPINFFRGRRNPSDPVTATSSTSSKSTIPLAFFNTPTLNEHSPTPRFSGKENHHANNYDSNGSMTTIPNNNSSSTLQNFSSAFHLTQSQPQQVSSTHRLSLSQQQQQLMQQQQQQQISQENNQVSEFNVRKQQQVMLYQQQTVESPSCWMESPRVPESSLLKLISPKQIQSLSSLPKHRGSYSGTQFKMRDHSELLQRSSQQTQQTAHAQPSCETTTVSSGSITANFDERAKRLKATGSSSSTSSSSAATSATTNISSHSHSVSASASKSALITIPHHAAPVQPRSRVNLVPDSSGSILAKRASLNTLIGQSFVGLVGIGGGSSGGGGSFATAAVAADERLYSSAKKLNSNASAQSAFNYNQQTKNMLTFNINSNHFLQWNSLLLEEKLETVGDAKQIGKKLGEVRQESPRIDSLPKQLQRSQSDPTKIGVKSAIKGDFLPQKVHLSSSKVLQRKPLKTNNNFNSRSNSSTLISNFEPELSTAPQGKNWKSIKGMHGQKQFQRGISSGKHAQSNLSSQQIISTLPIQV